MNALSSDFEWPVLSTHKRSHRLQLMLRYTMPVLPSRTTIVQFRPLGMVVTTAHQTGTIALSIHARATPRSRLAHLHATHGLTAVS